MRSEKLGKLLRRLRQERGMTQVQLAAKLGVHKNNAWRWEMGTRPNDSELAPLAEVLGAAVATLRDAREARYSNDSDHLAEAFETLSPDQRDFALGFMVALANGASRDAAIQAGEAVAVTRRATRSDGSRAKKRGAGPA